MNHDGILAAYDGLLPALLDAGERLRHELALWLAADPTLKVHSVTLRLKSRESLARKLARPDRSYAALSDVTDLIGLRIITYFDDAVDRVARLLEARLPVALEHSVDKRRRLDSTAFGYRSLHYVCRLEAPRVAAGTDAGGAIPCFEVQIRTVLEHAWAEIEHDLGYKVEAEVPRDARRRLSRLAGLLELADQEFVAIRTGLEAYAQGLPGRISAARETVPLDRISLLHLLECDEVRRVDDAIAGVLGKPLGAEPFFPAYLLRMLETTGIRTVEEARAGVGVEEAAILAMVRPYFAFAFRTWRLSPDASPALLRGYSLFFLAHVSVLRSATLRIDKVARLTQLYQQLDYPDDERAAKQIAGLLLDYFADVA